MSATRNWEGLVGLVLSRRGAQSLGFTLLRIDTLGGRFAEELHAHDQGCEAIGQRVNAGPLLSVNGIVGPYDVKASVDMGYRDCVQCGVA